MIRLIVIPACALAILGGCSSQRVQAPAPARFADGGDTFVQAMPSGDMTVRQGKAVRVAKPKFQAREKPAPGALVAEIPTLSVGETWAYKTPKGRSVIITITKITDAEIFVRNLQGKTGVYDRQWNLKINPSLNEDHVAWKFIPKRQRYNFPMFAGKVWKEKHVEKSRAREVDARGIAMVIGEEDVTVPAGTFKTLKIFIQHECTALKSTENEGYRKATYWYAPKIKRHVKSRISTSCEGDPASDGVDFVRYQVK